MAIKIQQYVNMLMALMPRGLLWEQLQEDLTFVGIVESVAEEFALLDAREDDLLDEADPRTTYEMLPEWETAYKLPDPCVDEPLTIELRQKTLVTKVTNKGGQSRQFFIDLAKNLGYDITITEFSRWTVADRVDKPLLGEDWNFAWQVNAPSETVTYWTARSRVDEPLATWGNKRLECALTRLKPDHTTLIFSYGG
jgi:uncharacterized protein YmfQ (DUF2313 family)